MNSHIEPTLPQNPVSPEIKLTPEYKALHVKPLSRLTARYIDAFIFLNLAWIPTCYLASSVIIRLLSLGALMCAVEAVFVSTWGTTVGKWLMNIKLRNLAGNKLSFKEGFMRSMWMNTLGRGFGMPILNTLMLFLTYKDLIKKGTTTWDKNLFVVTHKKIGLVRTFFVIAIVSLLIAGVIVQARHVGFRLNDLVV